MTKRPLGTLWKKIKRWSEWVLKGMKPHQTHSQTGCEHSRVSGRIWTSSLYNFFFFTGSQWANIGTLQAAAAGPGWYLSDNTNSEKKPKTEASRHRAFYSDKIGHFFVSDFCSWRDYMKTEKRRFFFFMGVEKWKTLSSGLHFFLTQAVHLKKEQKNQKSQWMISLLVVLHYIQKRIGSGPQVLLSINRLFIFFHTCCFVSVRKEPYSCKLQIESRWKIDCFCLEKAHFLTYSQQQAHM